MKAKIVLTTLLSLNFYLLSSQVPQGFNYQAIARDAEGNQIITTTLQVKLALTADSLGTIILWEELFNPVTTNAYGMFIVVLGKGTRQSTSTVPLFTSIDWNVTPIWVRTQVYYQNDWKNMGSTRLWSVPYALLAKGVGTLPYVNVKGETGTMDSALFVVRNNTGQIVFAVYNEGVRIYVDDGVAKGATKGGFAIGSFDKSKGTSQPLFVVDPDSIRAYIDNNPVKAVKGGFAIGGFDRSKLIGNQKLLTVSDDSVRIYINDDLLSKAVKGGFAIGSFDKSKGYNVNYFNVTPDSTLKVVTSQNRILWYPLKNALLAGKVIAENKDSVGENSFASGYESRSKGKYSQALGYKAIARGDYSTAIGRSALANKINSFAFGDSARAANSESYAIGRGANASGYRSFAFGSAGVDTLGNATDVPCAFGDYSFAIGQGSKSIGKGSFSLGIADTAQGDFSLAIGYKTKAGGDLSTAVGFNTVASGIFATAMGYMTNASGNSATVMGSGTKASGIAATAMGSSTFASGDWSTTTGLSSYASGTISIAMGLSTQARGWCSLAAGYGSNAAGATSLAIGYLTNTRGDFSTAMGYSTIAGAYSHVFGRFNDTTMRSGSPSWNLNDPLFIIANGNSNSTRSNAFTVFKNGKTTIGNILPTQMLDVNGNARFRSVSSGTFAYDLNLTSDGTLSTATSDVRMKGNIIQITDALEKVSGLRGVTFTWKNDSLQTHQLGMIAQEVEKVLPEIVFTNPVDGLKGINYSQTSALFVEAIKEQQQQIETQKQENQQLRSELDELKSLVNTLVANQTGQGNK
jgi:hypothetical protein